MTIRAFLSHTTWHVSTHDATHLIRRCLAPAASVVIADFICYELRVWQEQEDQRVRCSCVCTPHAGRSMLRKA